MRRLSMKELSEIKENMEHLTILKVDDTFLHYQQRFGGKYFVPIYMAWKLFKVVIGFSRRIGARI